MLIPLIIASASFVFLSIMLAAFTSALRKGLAFREVQWDKNREIGEKVRRMEEAEDIFFDEGDIAAAQAHREHPDFGGTVVEINGVRVGKNGLPAEEPRKKTIFERIRGD